MKRRESEDMENNIPTEIVDEKFDEEKFQRQRDTQRLAIKSAIFTIIINTMLSLFKLFSGIIGKSYAMVADAIHSFSDVFTSVIVIVGILIASKKADRGHPYGHERFECVTALILAFILFDVGAVIGLNAGKTLFSGEGELADPPKLIALIASVVSILTQILLFAVTRLVAKKTNFTALKADAWHHLSDSLSSIGSFIGIFGAMMGLWYLDSLAGIVISIIIIKVAVSIFIDSINKMTDSSAPQDIQKGIIEVAKTTEGVCYIDSLRTRLFGNYIYIDIEISCDENLILKEAHQIAQNVHDRIEKNFENVKHCLVHVNPSKIKSNN